MKTVTVEAVESKSENTISCPSDETYDIPATHNGEKLDWPHLWEQLGMERDKGGRWYPGDDTPEYVVEYLRGYRSPSRAWPYSYAKPLLTKKFARYLCEQDPQTAKKCGVAE